MEISKAIQYTLDNLILKLFIFKQKRKYFIYTSQKKKKIYDLFYSSIQ